MVLSTNSEAARLADQLERSFHGGAWHGPATRETVAAISHVTAAHRRPGSPHTIVEIVRHITFWLNAAHVRIATGKDIDADADWPEERALTEERWKQAISELETAYLKLHSTVIDLEDTRLDDGVSGSDPTIRGLLLGTLQHTAYHTGQIVQIAQELSI